MLDRLTGLTVFVKVASLGSLSAAARALDMSQTMATKHMASLEARLGAKLLHRTTRRVTLTEVGRNYLEAATRILADVEDADAAASAETLEVRGTIRLNAPVAFGVREVAPLIAAFTGAHPNIIVDLGLNDRRVDIVEEGWDVVVRIGTMPDSALIARRLCDCPTVVVAAPDYLARHSTPGGISELSSHNCLCYTLSERTGGIGHWHFGPRGAISVPVSGNLRSSSSEALVAAAVAGQGIAYVPTFLAHREIACGALTSLVLDHPTVSMNGIHAVYQAGRHPPAKTRAFIEHLSRNLHSAAWQAKP